MFFIEFYAIVTIFELKRCILYRRNQWKAFQYQPNHREWIMNLELLSQLEGKVQAALETIELLKMELDDQRKMNVELKKDNEGLTQQLEMWNEKVNGLLNRINTEVKGAF